MSESILDLDVGNSRIKWKVEGFASGICENNRLVDLSKIQWPIIDRIRVSCVAGEDFSEEVSSYLKKKFSINPEFATSLPCCAGLMNMYENPKLLGVDRWLACLAAWHIAEHEPVLVIDVGSAITIDTVNDSAQFLGGYIIPGLQLMQKSLVSETGGIVCDIAGEFQTQFDLLPVNTGEAVQRGASFVAVSIAERAAARFLRCWPSGRVFFTGGGGVDVVNAVSGAYQYEPDLVLDGLAIALP